MGVMLRFKERVRESACLGGVKHVPVTNNARNEEMMKAANVFSVQVKNCQEAIAAGCATNVKLLSTTQTAMATVLPQAYDDSGAGASPSSPTPTVVGGPACNVEKVSALNNNMVHKLEIEVLAPLTRWQGVHQQLQARFKALNKARLEVDARRHSYSKMSQKVSAMRVKVSDGIEPERKVDSMVQKMSHKEAKVKIATEDFDQQEAQLARDLEALITDAHYLKHYIAAALRLQGTTLLDGSDAFGDHSVETHALTAPTSPSVAVPPAPASPLGSASRTTVSEAGDAHAQPGGSFASPSVTSVGGSMSPADPPGALAAGSPTVVRLANSRPASVTA